MISRRGFLGAIGAAIAGAAVDPERLGWVKGERVYTFGALIERPPQPVTLSYQSWVDESGVFHYRSDQIVFLTRDGIYTGPPRVKIGQTLNLRRPPRFRARIG